MLIENKTLDGTPIEKLTKANEKKIRAKCDGCGGGNKYLFGIIINYLRRNIIGMANFL